MKKIRTLIMELLLGLAGTSAFAQGYPVLDIANLMESIESVYQYYQQIQNTIEQVQNTYTQIEQAAQQMATMNWDDLKDLGRNFDGLSSNPFEAITGVRNSAQEITAAVNENMNKINAFQESLTKKTISFGGMNVSVADLCAGNPNNNIFGFTQNAWDYTTDTENGAFSDVVKGYTGKLSYWQKRQIMKKYGMSPENYATLELANYELSEIVKSSNILGTLEYQERLLEESLSDANALQLLAEKCPDGSIYAATQLNTSALATGIRALGGLQRSINQGVGVISNYIFSEKTKDAVEQQANYEKQEKQKESLNGSSMKADSGL